MRQREEIGSDVVQTGLFPGNLKPLREKGWSWEREREIWKNLAKQSKRESDYFDYLTFQDKWALGHAMSVPSRAAFPPHGAMATYLKVHLATQLTLFPRQCLYHQRSCSVLWRVWVEQERGIGTELRQIQWLDGFVWGCLHIQGLRLRPKLHASQVQQCFPLALAEPWRSLVKSRSDSRFKLQMPGPASSPPLRSVWWG